MPLTRVEIEQIGPGKWVAEVEGGGGASAVRRNVVGSSFDEIILAVVEAHAAVTPAPKPPAAAAPSNEHARPVPRGPTATERAAAESEALGHEVDELPALNELRDQAQELGIDVDLRWRERRLMDEIEAAKARQAAGSAA
jgi:ribosomal protein L13E